MRDTRVARIESEIIKVVSNEEKKRAEGNETSD